MSAPRSPRLQAGEVHPFTGTLPDALDTLVSYAHGTAQDHGDAAQTTLTGQLRHSDPDRVAEICAAALLRLACGAADATPIKEWAWRDPRNGFVQPVADMDAVMMAGRRIGRPIDVLTRTYPAGTTPPEWNLVSPLDMSAMP